jgi:hypothetical protein
MKRHRLAATLFSALLAVAAAAAQNASPTATELLGEWNIVAMYGIDSDTVQAIDDANGTFSFEKRGKGSVIDRDTVEAVEFSWRANDRDRTIVISTEDSTRIEGKYTIQGNVLVLIMIQDENEAGVIVMTKRE